MPILASIYRGLNGIVNSSQLGNGCHAFRAHYVHVWLAQYFNTHQSNPPRQLDSTMAKFSKSSSIISFDKISVREHIMWGTNFAWHSTFFALGKQHIFTDDHNLSSFKFNYFMSLQSNRRGEHSEELPASVLEMLYQLYRSCTRIGTKFKPQLDEISDETPLIQRSRCLKEKFSSDGRSTLAGDCDSNKCWKHISSDRFPRDVANNPVELVLNMENLFTEGTTLDGPESNDNTILGPNQFELVARNLGKPSDLTPFSNAEKRLPLMPTTPILTQPVLCAPTTSSIFSVTTITSEQYHKVALGVGERI
ncbi:hypothetical protein ACH5RR_021377 [Cinchona calisaya]|uniref:Uncharacterized protein n=1 Tax=Cinchona calisaya TaxID=153742 RepID=A0ABD2ZHC1_9GENT